MSSLKSTPRRIVTNFFFGLNAACKPPRRPHSNTLPASLQFPLTHPCHSPHAPCHSPHALKGQKLLAQGIRPGYSCPHAWRPERAKALYDLRPALSPVSVSLSPVFGVIAGKVCNYSFIFIFLPLPFLRS